MVGAGRTGRAVAPGQESDHMAKASERKGIRKDERECCLAERRKQLEAIRLGYASFPVIRSIPCPTCKMILHIRVYERPDADATA